MSDQTKQPFRREPRYTVFKISDAIQFLPQPLIEHLNSIGNEIAAGRSMSGKPPFNAVVVEQDRPEFDLVWEMIEARMTGEGNDARRIVACRDACSGMNDADINALADGRFHPLDTAHHSRSGLVKLLGAQNFALTNLKSQVSSESRAKLKWQLDVAWEELREIREATKANPEESTADEVRRVVKQRDDLLAAAKNLRDVKGRHHSEQAFKALVDVIAKVEAT